MKCQGKHSDHRLGSPLSVGAQNCGVWLHERRFFSSRLRVDYQKMNDYVTHEG